MDSLEGTRLRLLLSSILRPHLLSLSSLLIPCLWFPGNHGDSEADAPDTRPSIDFSDLDDDLDDEWEALEGRQAADLVFFFCTLRRRTTRRRYANLK